METITLFLIIIMAGLSALLLFLSVISWYRLKNVKLAIISIAFLIFFMKSVFLFLDLLSYDIKTVGIDALILILLYFAVIKK